MAETIYHLPKEYDLEHATQESDVEFYIELAQRWQPRRILELGCGTGRVLIPLAASAPRATRQLVGLDSAPEMLDRARKKAMGSTGCMEGQIDWLLGDLKTHHDNTGFDLIIAPCGTLCHLVSLKDQLITWQTAFSNLHSDGRFVADVPMAELPVLAESAQHPRRAILQLDHETSLATDDARKRLIRYKAVTYHPASQRASVHYLYDKFRNDEQPERFLSDYEHHVYYPRELELLFRMAGFHIESVWGDYNETPLKDDSPALLMVGRKP